MGDYTHIYFSATLIFNEYVFDILEAIIEYRVIDFRTHAYIKDIDHDFFKTERWKSLLSNSAYINTEPIGRVTVEDREEIRVTINGQLKNYDNEIEKFFDWIEPYIETEFENSIVFIGFIRYEADIHPTLVYIVHNQIKFSKEVVL